MGFAQKGSNPGMSLKFMSFVLIGGVLYPVVNNKKCGMQMLSTEAVRTLLASRAPGWCGVVGASQQVSYASQQLSLTHNQPSCHVFKHVEYTHDVLGNGHAVGGYIYIHVEGLHWLAHV